MEKPLYLEHGKLKINDQEIDNVARFNVSPCEKYIAILSRSGILRVLRRKDNDKFLFCTHFKVSKTESFLFNKESGFLDVRLKNKTMEIYDCCNNFKRVLENIVVLSYKINKKLGLIGVLDPDGRFILIELQNPQQVRTRIQNVKSFKFNQDDPNILELEYKNKKILYFIYTQKSICVGEFRRTPKYAVCKDRSMVVVIYIRPSGSSVDLLMIDSNSKKEKNTAMRVKSYINIVNIDSFSKFFDCPLLDVSLRINEKEQTVEIENTKNGSLFVYDILQKKNLFSSRRIKKYSINRDDNTLSVYQDKENDNLLSKFYLNNVKTYFASNGKRKERPFVAESQDQQSSKKQKVLNKL